MNLHFSGIYTFYKQPDTEVGLAQDNYGRISEYKTSGHHKNGVIKAALGGGDRNLYYSRYFATDDRLILMTPQVVDQNESLLFRTLMTLAERIKDDGLSARSVLNAFANLADSPTGGDLPTTFNDVELDQGGQL